MSKRNRSTDDAVFAFGEDQTFVPLDDVDHSLTSSDDYTKVAVLTPSILHPSDLFASNTGEHTNGPFQILQKMSDDELQDFFSLNGFTESNMDKFVQELSSKFTFSDTKSNTFLQHFYNLFQNKFQISYMDILLKPVCAQIPNAIALQDAFVTSTNFFRKRSILTLKYRDKFIVEKEIFVGHVSNNVHFLGYMIIITKADNFGLIILMDPTGAEAGNRNALKDQIIEKAKFICAVKNHYKVFGTNPPPDLYQVSVGFPPEFTQKLPTGDLQCSFWSVIHPWLFLRMYKFNYQRPGGGISAFLKALRRLFPVAGTEYNFMEMYSGIGIDFKYTFSEIKIYCCLLIQYYLQIKEMSKWNSSKRIVHKTYSNLETLVMKPQDMLNFSTEYPKTVSKNPYVLAGDSKAYAHYKQLKEIYDKKKTDEERNAFVKTLHEIDIFRLTLQKFDTGTNTSFMKRLFVYNKSETKYKYSLKRDFQSCQYIALESPVVTSTDITNFSGDSVSGSSVDMTDDLD
jgi:hypothetical protein